ncbi:MAG: 2Fe-2S iron-sulfur cluster-binding protein [Spirochaetaceae bacterium]|jgi:Na+-transporting NADH:ubiquinone oxidoreductase subunit F|nr:2Fe-2S iron-sulfur cluster-binding protein [Spirochaetaceae bacterium]
MSFLPVIVMNVILLLITILLLIAEKLLVSYGDCKITVSKGDDKEEFVVNGGSNLLTYLNEKGYEISSSCAGKGSCGYCKVRVVEGGGQILPTEEIFMSRKEKKEDMRLACQVKVKNDVNIVIPDYLTIVRQMVVSKNFDPNKRWLVKIH